MSIKSTLLMLGASLLLFTACSDDSDSSTPTPQPAPSKRALITGQSWKMISAVYDRPVQIAVDSVNTVAVTDFYNSPFWPAPLRDNEYKFSASGSNFTFQVFDRGLELPGVPASKIMASGPVRFLNADSTRFALDVTYYYGLTGTEIYSNMVITKDTLKVNYREPVLSNGSIDTVNRMLRFVKF